jgi:hypothetical protein
MTRSLYCLVGFAAWAALLVSSIGVVRWVQVLTGRKRVNEFPGGVQHGGDVYWRLNRAHINTVENLPIFATLILVAQLLHVGVLLPAEIVLGARVVQSLIHVSSGSPPAVTLRFTAFATQVACFVTMIVKILSTI